MLFSVGRKNPTYCVFWLKGLVTRTDIVYGVRVCVRTKKFDKTEKNNMRHGSSNSRRRNRGGGGNGGRRGNNQRMQVYDSNGPDVRIRGTAHQVAEKYMALAKDASSSGDIVLAQSYLQHAEHYNRIINSFDKDVQASDNAKETKAKESNKDGNKKADKEDDLSLPASILGEASNIKSEQQEERTAEAAAS
jgi:hypothetical protein